MVLFAFFISYGVITMMGVWHFEQLSDGKVSARCADTLGAA